MTLAADMVTDAIAMCDPAELGESLAYTPSGGAEKTIRAIVERSGLDPDPQIRGVVTRRVTLHVPRHATYGVTSVKEGYDTVKVDIAPGDTSQVVHRIERVIGSSPGFFMLRAVR